MLIANPIYDVVFKFLMEDNKIAKLIVSKIIGEEILELEPKPQERTFKVGAYNGLSVYHLDFAATIKTEEGTKKVIIEIQKAKFAWDIMRFRKYLGNQYSDESNSYNVAGKIKAMPIISIYFINYPLENLESPVIKVNRSYLDLATKEIIEAKNEFVESLTHDAYIIQIQKLKSNRRNDLEILLSIFDQDNRYEDFHILKINEENFPEEYRPIIRRLQKAQEERQVRDTMDAEDMILAELQNKERIAQRAIEKVEKVEYELEKAKQEIERAKQEADRAKQEKELANEEADKAKQLIAEQDKLIKELMEKLNR